jgi:hypothetical protein
MADQYLFMNVRRGQFGKRAKQLTAYEITIQEWTRKGMLILFRT